MDRGMATSLLLSRVTSRGGARRTERRNGRRWCQAVATKGVCGLQLPARLVLRVTDVVAAGEVALGVDGGKLQGKKSVHKVSYTWGRKIVGRRVPRRVWQVFGGRLGETR